MKKTSEMGESPLRACIVLVCALYLSYCFRGHEWNFNCLLTLSFVDPCKIIILGLASKYLRIKNCNMF